MRGAGAAPGLSHAWARVPKANQMQIVKMIRTIGPTIVAVPRNFIHWRIKRCRVSPLLGLFPACETFYCLPKICSLQPPKGGSASISPMQPGAGKFPKVTKSSGPTLPALCETARGRNWVDKHRGAVLRSFLPARHASRFNLDSEGSTSRRRR